MDVLKRIVARNAAVRHAAFVGEDIHDIAADFPIEALPGGESGEEPSERGDDHSRGGGELDPEESGEGRPDSVGDTEGDARSDDGE